MRFRLAPNSSTLDELERRKRPTRRNKQKIPEPTIKISTKIDLCYRLRKVGLCICVYADMYRLLPRDAMQSAVVRLHVVCPSV